MYPLSDVKSTMKNISVSIEIKYAQSPYISYENISVSKLLNPLMVSSFISNDNTSPDDDEILLYLNDLNKLCFSTAVHLHMQKNEVSR